MTRTEIEIKRKMRCSGFLFVLLLLQMVATCYGQSCGGTYSSDRTFTSPNYPSNYRNNLRCDWIFEKPGNYKVTIVFASIATESCCDFVYVYEFINGVQRIMNSRYRGSHGQITLTSSGNKMRVYFSSDYSVSQRGFSARVTFVRQRDPVITIPSGGVRTLSSPGYPANYGNGVWVSWLFANQDASGILTVSVNDMNIQSNDHLEMRDGNSSDSRLLGQFYGTRKPNPVFSTSRFVWILFRTDLSSVNKGFQLSVTAGCSANITANEGTITSPGYPNTTYNNNLRCQWRIQRTSNVTNNVTFHLNDLNTEQGRDVLTARNSSGDELASISGNSSDTIFFTSSSTDLTIFFTTDNRNSYAGFSLTFSPDCPPLSITGGFLTGGRHYLGNTSVTCNNDYYLASSNGSTIQCNYGAVWSQPIPVCKRWYSPSIESTSQGFVQEGSLVRIRCIGNTLPQSSIQLVNSLDHVVRQRVVPTATNSFNVILDNIRRNDTEVYRCRETINGRTKYSIAVSLNVTWMRQTEMSTEANSSVPIGSTIILKCRSAGYPSPRYTWYKNNVLVNGTDCSTLTLPAVTYDDHGSYHCVAANGYGSSISNQEMLNVWNLTIPTTSSVGLDSGFPQEGSNVTLNCFTGDQEATLTWVDNSGYVISQSSTLRLKNVTKQNSGSYRCKSQRENLEVYSYDLIVNVSYIHGPKLNILPSNVIDKHTNAILECNVDSFPPTTTFSWFFQNIQMRGETSQRMIIRDITESNIGLYTCSVNLLSNTHTSSVSMLVNYLTKPTLSLSPSTTVNENDAVILSCNSSGSGSTTYQWFKDGANIPQTSMFHVINSVQRNDVGNYKCVAMNDYHNSSSNTVLLNVNYLDLPYVVKRNMSNTLKLNCSSNGIPQPTYHWTHYGEVVGNDSLLLLKDINDTYIATYICHVKNVVGEYSAKINANEQYLNKPKLQMLPSENAYEGDSLMMTCETDGSKPITYHWFKDGVMLPERSAMYTLSTVHRSHAGSYKCQATNGQGVKMSYAVTLSVYYINTPSISSSGTNLEKIMLHDHVTVLCTASGNPPLSLTKWYKDSIVVGNLGRLYIRDVDLTKAGRYVCKAAIGKLIKETSIEITVNYINTPRIAQFPTNIMESSAVTLQCIGDSNMPLTYRWFKDGVRIDDLTNKNTHSWTNILRKDSGKYTCQTISSLGTKISNAKIVDVEYIDDPQIYPSKNITMYENDTVILTCEARTNKAGVSYGWYHNGMVKSTQAKLFLSNVVPSNAGSYWCYVIGGLVSKFTVTKITVNYLHMPQLQIVPQLSVQENSTLVVTCNTDSNLPVTYTMFKDGVQLTNQKQLVIAHARREQAGGYSCTVANGMQQKSTKSSAVVVRYHDQPIIKASKDQLKEGDAVILTCESSAVPSATISWHKNGTLLSHNIELTLKNLSREDGGMYVCKTQNEDSEMVSSRYLMVEYIEQPMIKTLNDSKPVIGQKISLLCKSQTSSQETPTYAWSKDGVLLSGENATNVLELTNVTESDSGVYTCAAKNNIGSKTSASFELKVHDYCKDAICDVNAYCVNGEDSHQCQCNGGYAGSGKTCAKAFQTGASKAEQQEKYYRHTTLWLGVVVGVLGLAVFVFLVVMVWKCRTLRNKKDDKIEISYSKNGDGFDNMNFRDGDLEI